MNLLAQYCNFGTHDMLKIVAVNSLIQYLRLVHEENGYTTSWTLIEDRAYGNSLINNQDISKCKKLHKFKLSQLGIVIVNTRPPIIELVSGHESKFWLDGNTENILLHAILVLDLNLGLPYDQVGKLKANFL